MAAATFSTNTNSSHEISRLLTAAVINNKFRSMLLNQPELALANGYNGEPFQLASDDKARITSIHASNLADFAIQLTDRRGSSPFKLNYQRRPEAALFPSIGLD
jgi:hypothetical protein